MKILHSSDWHLGRKLCGRSRTVEFSAMLNWFIETINKQQVEVLLLCGDIFDSSTPGSRAQEQYYDFLRRAVSSPYLKHIVITAGNHDSPSFLAAPSRLLRNFNIHVVGSANVDDELLLLNDDNGTAQLIVCAVPFLRERDLRLSRQGDSVEEKDRQTLKALSDHYHELAQKAVGLRDQLLSNGLQSVPIVAMGHLFAAGGQVLEGDGVRDLNVGSLAYVPAAIFPSCFSYFALGHLHLAQKVAACDNIRYSGSPLPMGFNEGKKSKSVTLIDLHPDGSTEVELIELPKFRALGRIAGDWNVIEKQISDYNINNPTAWLEIEYTGSEIIDDLRGRVEALIEGTQIEILRIKDRQLMEKVLSLDAESRRELSELDPMEVFKFCLDSHDIQNTEREILTGAYSEILSNIYDVSSEENI